MAILYTKVVHNGTVSSAHGGFKDGASVGPIYIGDIVRREDLPEFLSANGADQYIDSGTTAHLVETGEVLLSVASGTLAMYATMGVVSITTGVTSIAG